MRGLYIHIPFCNKICSYCDFVKRVPKNKDVVDEYLQKLVEEVSSYKDTFSSIDTIYIGGGTPSMLDVNQLTYLLESLKKIHPIEYTIEINPETYTHEKGELFKKYGVNRFSLGVETFNEDLLKILNRSHNNGDVKNAIDDLRSLGLTNINIDMIFAIPGQTINDLKNDIKILMTYNPTHISYYSLILEENTYFYHQYAFGKLNLVDEDHESLMYSEVIDSLNLTYKHYEISNFAKPGFESKHNLLYWTMNEYIGIGLGAHGFIDNHRTQNTRVLTKYLKIPFESKISQDKNALIQDTMIFGLRKIDGVNINDVNKKYEVNIMELYPEINNLISDGLLKLEDNILSLTRKGIFLGNQVFMVFI